MKLISHRGNISGRQPENENSPGYIDHALELGYDVEVDVWFIDGLFYLGHDRPQYNVTIEYLQQSQLWCHAKNIGALAEMAKYIDIHYFWHQEDAYTITSRVHIWVYPKKELCYNSICVMPERGFIGDLSNCYGICSDSLIDINIEELL